MKILFKTLGLLLLVASLYSCGVQKDSTCSRMHLKHHSEAATDSLEYEILIFDTDFDRWLTMQAENENFYSDDYLRNRNAQYVDAWNRLYTMGDRRVQSYIDYDRTENYGKTLDFKLFTYFKYFQERYRINLLMI